MSFEDKYVVIKRGQEMGSYTAKEIIDLLRMKEISTIHKVRVDGKDVTVAAFIETYETGGLPEQNLGKPKPAKEKKKKAKEKVTDAPVAPPPQKKTPPPKPGPSDEIHVSRGAERFGPYMVKEVQEYLKSGNLRFSDLAWYNGVDEWVPLSTVPGLGEGITTLHAAPPPPPKPPPQRHKPTPPPAKKAEAPKEAPKKVEPEEVEASPEEEEEVDWEEIDSPPKKKKRRSPMKTFALTVSMIGLFLVAAYFGSAWLHNYKLKGELERFMQRVMKAKHGEVKVTDLEMGGFYLIDDPRVAKVYVTRNGKTKIFKFEISGNGITKSAKVEPLESIEPIDDTPLFDQ